MINKLRLVILLVVGVPALILGGGYVAYQAIAGDGEITLVAPPDVELKYSLDNGALQTLAAGQHTRLKAKQGEHTAALDFGDGATTRKFKVSNGFADMLVPGKGQCFAVLDVAKSHYDYGHGAAKFPEVDKRIAEDQPADLPGSLYFDEMLAAQLAQGRQLLQAAGRGALRRAQGHRRRAAEGRGLRMSA